MLTKLCSDVSQIKSEVHTLTKEAATRERSESSRSNGIMSLAALMILNLCAMVWWGATLQAQVTSLSSIVTDLEIRMRAEEQISNRNHNTR